MGGVAVNDIQTWESDEPRDYDDQIRQANYETTSVYGFGHPLYYKNVIDTLRGVAEPETDGREGLKSPEVIIAAYLSARDGKQSRCRWSIEWPTTLGMNRVLWTMAPGSGREVASGIFRTLCPAR